jgi:hypothetical protein
MGDNAYTFRSEIYVIKDTPESAQDSAEDRDNGMYSCIYQKEKLTKTTSSRSSY